MNKLALVLASSLALDGCAEDPVPRIPMQAPAQVQMKVATPIEIAAMQIRREVKGVPDNTLHLVLHDSSLVWFIVKDRDSGQDMIVLCESQWAERGSPLCSSWPHPARP